MDDDYETGVEVLLSEFIEYFQLPQTVKVIEGVYGSEDSDEEFSNGDVITLNDIVCPAAVLTFKCPKTHQEKSVSVDVSHAARFQLEKFDPARPHLGSGDDIIFETVQDLVGACPRLVRARKSYVHPQNPESRFNAGEYLRPVRLVQRCGAKFLECRLVKSSKLVLLPLGCVGGFELADDSFYYTLHELVHTLPSPRRMKFAPDIINERCEIPEIPRCFPGTITLEKPEFSVNVNPVQNPGYMRKISSEIGIRVSPRADTYMGYLEHEYSLHQFVVDNEMKFPLKAQVTTWEEQTSVLEAFSIRPGSLLTMHVLKSVAKYALQHDGQYFLVPPDYQGEFQRAPRMFNLVQDIEGLGPLLIRVKEGGQVSRPELEELYGTEEGTVLQVLTGEAKVVRLKSKIEPETEVLEMRQISGDDHGVMHVPLCLAGAYEEILQETTRFQLKEAEKFTMPMDVEVHTAAKLRGRDQLPVAQPMKLYGLIREPCVLVTAQTDHKHSVAFDLPLRTQIYVTFLKKEQRSSPSASSKSVVENISEETHQSIKKNQDVYQDMEPVAKLIPGPPLPSHMVPRRKPERVPLKQPPEPVANVSTIPISPEPKNQKKGLWRKILPLKKETKPKIAKATVKSVTHDKTEHRNGSHGAAKPVAVPPRRPLKPAGTRSRLSTLSFKKRAPTPPPIPEEDNSDGPDYEVCDSEVPASVTRRQLAKQTTDDQDEDSHSDYEQVFDSETLQLPENGDLSKFTVPEMVAFLEFAGVPSSIIRDWRQEKIDGSKFARMTHDRLKELGLQDNGQLMHFRKRTRRSLGLFDVL